MFKFSHATLIAVSGFIWLAIGGFLLSLGLRLILGSIQPEFAYFEKHLPLLDNLTPIFGGIEQAALLLIAFCLMIGYFKGRYVLGKSARRGVARLLTFPNPTSIGNLYSSKYYLLLGAMVGLGMSIKYLGLPNDVRGAVDVAIGAALINGAMIYFRLAYAVRKSEASVSHL